MKSLILSALLLASTQAFAYGNLVTASGAVKLSKPGTYIITFQRSSQCSSKEINLAVRTGVDQNGNVELITGEQVYQGVMPAMCQEDGNVETATALVVTDVATKAVVKQDIGEMNPATVKIQGFKVLSVERVLSVETSKAK